MTLDTIIEQSLRSFYVDICAHPWRGRENEMVNLYALGHLARLVRTGTILSELTQIGIEVAVRQLPLEKFEGVDRTVRKDLVIWPAPRMTLWKAEGPEDESVANEPLAVMEWKVNHFLNSRCHKENRQMHNERRGDIHWLRETSNRPRMEDFTGYAVLVEDTQRPKRLSCVRVKEGSDSHFLALPTDKAES